jgi:uncharacterized protein YdbL (DUF1318 family)
MGNRHIEQRFMSYEDVAKALGMSPTEVRLCEKTALQKLRNRAKAGKIDSVVIAGKHWREE